MYVSLLFYLFICFFILFIYLFLFVCLADVQEELQKLQDVFQYGFISEAEFKERKKDIYLSRNLPVPDDQGLKYFIFYI